MSAFIHLIDSKYTSSDSESKPFDFGRKAQYLTLDVISDVAFGEPFGFLATDSDVHGYIKTTEENLPAIIMVTVLPWLNWLLQSPILKALLPSDKDQLGLGKIMGFVSYSLSNLDLQSGWANWLPALPNKSLARGLVQKRRSSEICSDPLSVMVSRKKRQSRKR